MPQNQWHSDKIEKCSILPRAQSKMQKFQNKCWYRWFRQPYTKLMR